MAITIATDIHASLASLCVDGARVLETRSTGFSSKRTLEVVICVASVNDQRVNIAFSNTEECKHRFLPQLYVCNIAPLMCDICTDYERV
jgi:hypothetical protein